MYIYIYIYPVFIPLTKKLIFTLSFFKSISTIWDPVARSAFLHVHNDIGKDIGDDMYNDI